MKNKFEKSFFDFDDDDDDNDYDNNNQNDDETKSNEKNVLNDKNERKKNMIQWKTLKIKKM